MEFTSLVWLSLVSFTFLCWKYSFCVYYVKWIVVYIVLQWRKLTAEKPNVVIFATKREEFLEKPRLWTKEKTFHRDSMLVFASNQDVWLLLEFTRGRHNSAEIRLHLQLASNRSAYYTSEQNVEPRACEAWTTDCLALQCLEPMRRWRIVFTGRLCCRDNDDWKMNKLVKINLIWAALSAPYHYATDADMFSLTSALAEQPLAHLQYNLDSLGKGYEQWGTVQGTVTIDDNVTNFHAPSLRRHSWKWPHVSARTSLVGLTDNGTLFSISYTFANIRTQLGHVRYPDGRIEPIVGTSNVETPTTRDKFVRTFSSSCYSHLAYVVCCPFKQWGGLQWAQARCTFDSQQAVCLALSWDKSMEEDLIKLPLLEWSTAESSELILSLDHPVCRNPAMVGGKAASLALLHDTSQTVLKNKIIVPKGFCLTVHAMQLQAQSSQSLALAVKFLGLISSGREMGNLQEECLHVVNAWGSVPLCSTLLAVLTERIRPGRSYAVRSSALGEDSTETSAAGQNITVLGCVDIDAVVAAVHKCWASLYTFQSVQYRRQAGLPVETLMGVVIQEMVEAEAAGVMFTRHPVTSDPHQLLITANYGLGETVVSGSVEPDSIIVNTEKLGHCTIESTVKGKKDVKMVVSDNGKVKVESVSEQLIECICLSEAEVIALAQVGMTLEHVFGWPKDIEWAINKGVIYLLQCRPVTSQLILSQDELLHELDSAILPNDAFSTANLGEVLPGATSPLSQSTMLRCADIVMIRRFCGVQHRLWYNNNKLVVSHHCSLLHLYNTILLEAEKEVPLQQKILELAICGHKISTPEIQKEASSRITPLSLTQKLLKTLHMIWQILISKSAAKKAQQIGEEFKVNCDTFTSSGALYAYLTASHTYMLEVFFYHTRVSFASTIWQIILFCILAEGKQELSEENIADIASLLVSNHSIVSSQIPKDIEELKKVVKTCEKWSELINLPPEKIPTWLEINCAQASTMLKELVQRYEHRSIKELDVMTQTWGLDCLPLLAMMQTMLRNSSNTSLGKDKKPNSVTNVMDHLKSPLKPLTRRLISWLMGLSCTAAERREITKDSCLRVIHQIRLGYIRLAQLLYQEGRLPNTRLVWFCTHYELGLLLGRPNPSLLRKISRRQRNWQEWDRLQFPEVMMGLPAPVQFSSHPSIMHEESVQGTLVCPGSVQGRACVLLSCKDSHTLQAGDILITHSTDVGWTPLFPLIAGVVTELGGLISHGAVVAREYGLPCVVGATNATLIFKTGDEVYLDGQSGKVQKISPNK